ncbi:hypothetical protein BGLA2_1580006 [Burkholderia gladioli]|nr:hypothetical protein BGLA2_1580006 [Burkholderia gladioli]
MIIGVRVTKKNVSGPFYLTPSHTRTHIASSQFLIPNKRFSRRGPAIKQLLNLIMPIVRGDFLCQNERRD